MPGYRHRPLSPIEESRIVRLITTGEMSLHAIAKSVGRSLYTVQKVKKKLERTLGSSITKLS